MNRYQFWSLTGLSSLVVLLLLLQTLLVRQASYEQNRIALAQQAINQGNAFGTNLKQLAMRIIQVSQQTQDQGLKDLLVRQQISFTPSSEGAGNSPTPAPAPAAH